MSDYLSALLVLGAFGALWWVSRWPVWSRCRCGAQYCTGCGTKRGK